MPIDSSIYSQMQPLDIGGAIEKGYRMKDLMEQRSERSALKDAYAKNMQTGEDGSLTLNRKSFLGDLGKVSPEKALAFQKEFSAQDKADQEQRFAQMQQAGKKYEMIGSLAGAVKDQPTWSLARNQAIRLGLAKPEELPEQYDERLVNQYRISALSAKDQIDRQFKEREVLVKESEARSKARESKGGLTEGFKAADKDYAKDYNDFTGGGQVKAVDAIAKLKDLKKEMEKDNGFIQAGGGPISGSMPDALRTQASISRRDNIVSVANSALKATFGGQLSDGERKALANEFYNDKLSNSENLRIIERKISELENGLETQKGKAAYFQRNGTLTGFGGVQEGGDTKRFKTSQIEWAD